MDRSWLRADAGAAVVMLSFPRARTVLSDNDPRLKTAPAPAREHLRACVTAGFRDAHLLINSCLSYPLDIFVGRGTLNISETRAAQLLAQPPGNKHG